MLLTQSLAAPYSFEDLQVLAEQKNFKEFLEHAHDVRPTLRNEKWSQYVVAMANEYLLWATKNERYDLPNFKKTELMSEWPTLKNDAFYLQRRENYGAKFFQNCPQSEKFNCTKEIERFWEKSSKAPEFSYNMALLYLKAQKNDDTEALTPFIFSLSKSSVSKFYCDKEIVQRTLMRELQERVKKIGANKDVKTNIDEILNQDCWSELAKILTPMLRSSQRELATLAHSLLKAKNQISQEDNDLFLVRYLIEWPVTGDTFNEAWNIMAKLGSDYERRMKLLDNIKRLDPLPGKLFALADDDKKSIILKHLSQNIPEYADLYARTCVNYMQGNGDFPLGNPTVECSELFQASSDNNWVEQGLKLKYSAIKKELSQ